MRMNHTVSAADLQSVAMCGPGDLSNVKEDQSTNLKGTIQSHTKATNNGLLSAGAKLTTNIIGPVSDYPPFRHVPQREFLTTREAFRLAKQNPRRVILMPRNKQPTVKKSHQQSGLLALPSEIRLKIIRHVVKQEIRVDGYPERLELFDLVPTKNLMKMVSICSQIRKEALPEFFAVNHFKWQISSGFQMWRYTTLTDFPFLTSIPAAWLDLLGDEIVQFRSLVVRTKIGHGTVDCPGTIDISIEGAGKCKVKVFALPLMVEKLYVKECGALAARKIETQVAAIMHLREANPKGFGLKDIHAMKDVFRRLCFNSHFHNAKRRETKLRRAATYLGCHVPEGFFVDEYDPSGVDPADPLVDSPDLGQYEAQDPDLDAETLLCAIPEAEGTTDYNLHAPDDANNASAVGLGSTESEEGSDEEDELTSEGDDSTEGQDWEYIDSGPKEDEKSEKGGDEK